MSAPASTGSSSWQDRDAPSLRTRVRRWGYRARRARLGSTMTLVVATLVIGIAIGRWTAPPDDPGGRRMLEDHVMPLALDADGIWTSGSDGATPVSEALVAIQRDQDATMVLESAPSWLDAYDVTLNRVAALELPAEARPVQRQFVAAITLSRDAVEVLARAATIEDPDRRAGLLTEVGRLRVRAEQLTQAARASILDLSGSGGEVTRLPEIPSFPAVDADPAG